ncbi:MAG: TetR/AcrR family transcriptional regulator [Clostridia bacterium]|nr:TetR/AcrR family transcriptional regulator [Clostridia bacterium]
MPRGSAERTQARRDEILDACAGITDRMTTEQLSIADIASETSFGRTSIYNYFKTREEIILALLARQYEEWADDIEELDTDPAVHDLQSFAAAFADTLAKRRLLLKLLNMNLFQVEESCRPESLRDFKASLGRSQTAVKRCLEKYWTDSSEDDRTAFIWAFYPFMHGLYSYANITDKQAVAMDAAGVAYAHRTAPEITLAFLQRYFGLLPAPPAAAENGKEQPQTG